jgi:hypothetical protein
MSTDTNQKSNELSIQTEECELHIQHIYCGKYCPIQCNNCDKSSPTVRLELSETLSKAVGEIWNNSLKCEICKKVSYDAHRCAECTARFIKLLKPHINKIGNVTLNSSTQAWLMELTEELLPTIGFKPYLHANEKPGFLPKLDEKDSTIIWEKITEEDMKNIINDLYNDRQNMAKGRIERIESREKLSLFNLSDIDDADQVYAPGSFSPDEPVTIVSNEEDDYWDDHLSYY